jgi:hypothetical protein
MKIIKVGICLEHADALKMFQESGREFPVIPEGKNTLVVHFITKDGKYAVLVNQRGFQPIAADNEEEVNGCMVAVILEEMEEIDEVSARSTLDQWVRGVLEV